MAVDELKLGEYYYKIKMWFSKKFGDFETIEEMKSNINYNICEILGIKSENDTSKVAIDKFFEYLDNLKKQTYPDKFATRMCSFMLREYGFDDVEYCQCALRCNECPRAIKEAFEW